MTATPGPDENFARTWQNAVDGAVLRGMERTVVDASDEEILGIVNKFERIDDLLRSDLFDIGVYIIAAREVARRFKNAR